MPNIKVVIVSEEWIAIAFMGETIFLCNMNKQQLYNRVYIHWKDAVLRV